VALADQTSREMVKEESAKVNELLRDVAKKIPGSIIDRRK
jgi:hypothetical protein